MSQHNQQPPKNSQNPAGVLIPAVVCALLCVFFNQSGAFFIISLLPIGVVALLFSISTAWVSVSYSILIYAANVFLFQRQDSFPVIDILLQTGVFSLMPVLFAWIIAPPQKGPAFLRMRTVFRFVISSIILFSVYIPIVYHLFQQEDFYQSFLHEIENVLLLIPLSNGSDVLEQSLITKYFTPENIIDNTIFYGLRGGGLVSIMLLFFFNRQLSFVLARITRRKRPAPEFIHFKISSRFIWLLSFSILTLLISLQFKFTIPEIIAWNVFVLCAMMYAVQGIGILLFFLNSSGVSRGLKILLNILIIVMIFRVTFFLIFLALMVILGILENWVPLRALKTNKPSSTPEA